MRLKNKVAVIGLDCAEPELVFGKFKSELPNLSRLMISGYHTKMRSSDPPITVPAWSVMFSGKDPGELGIYGFRNRADYSYNNLQTANAESVRFKRVWDYASVAGLTSIVIGVPQTYPVTELKGYMVAGMLAPEINAQAVFPQSLFREIKQVTPEYQTDIKNFRNEQRASLLKNIYAMTRNRFKLARHLLDTREWDLFVLVEIGLDRIQHAFWQYMAGDSPDFIPGNEFRNVVLKYYQYLDFEIGLLLKRFDQSTTVMIVSDHGAKTFRGVFFINEWLRREGYLSLKKLPDEPVKLTPEMIDWKATRVWAEGGYYGRLFFNVLKREPEGVVPAADLGRLKNEIKIKLTDQIRRNGKILKNVVLEPMKIYKRTEGFPPDLMVYFDDLAVRASATVGCDDLFSSKNDTGPDGANHNYNGIFILNRRLSGEKKRQSINILDITPTLLELLGVSVESEWTGSSLIETQLKDI